MKRHQRMLAAASLGLLMDMACQTQAADRDLDNDGRWDGAMLTAIDAEASIYCPQLSNLFAFSRNITSRYRAEPGTRTDENQQSRCDRG